MEPKVLRGWQEIADHLRVTVRHASRLANEKGLPVLRNSKLKRPYAHVEDLDLWMAGERGAAKEASQAASLSSEDQNGGAVVPVAQPDFVLSEASSKPPWPRNLLLLLAAMSLLALIAGVAFLARPAPSGQFLSGKWKRGWAACEGDSSGAGRLDTGVLLGAGSVVSCAVTPLGGEWSGGLEIYQDETHWTFLNLAPDKKEAVLWRYPSGAKDIIPLPALVRGQGMKVSLGLQGPFLEVSLGNGPVKKLEMSLWDVTAGHLVLRAGRQADEWGAEAPGHVRFGALKVQHPIRAQSWSSEPLPEGQSVQGHSFEARLFNSDDQLDLLLDGKRVASTGYLQSTQFIELSRFLAPCGHTLSLRVFNRQNEATYGVLFQMDGHAIWREECGEVSANGGGCKGLGSALGMVKELSYKFEVPGR